MQVTAESPDAFFWQYDVTNNNLSNWYPESPGMSHFGVGGPGVDTAAAYDVATSVAGWTVWESGGSLWAGTPDIFGYGPAVARGDTASLAFRTQPCPVVPATGTAAMALWPDEDGLPVGIPLISVPQGAAKGPGVVKVEITKGDGQPVGAEGLKVAKWEQAFKTDPQNNVVLKGPDPQNGNLDFIDLDPDNFIVWVYDPAVWAAMSDGKPAHPRLGNKVSINSNGPIIHTVDPRLEQKYSDERTYIDMVRYEGLGLGKGTGWYWSDTQILVSNTKDDEYADASYLQTDEAAPGGDGQPKRGTVWKISDRTHITALSGNVSANYEFLPSFSVSAGHEVPVKKFVRVHATIMEAPGGGGVIRATMALRVLATANEQLAQAGVRLSFDIEPNPVGWPTDVDLGDGLDYSVSTTAAGRIVMTNEEMSLMAPSLRTPELDDIELYFVNYLSWINPANGKREEREAALGESFPATGSPCPRYEDSVIISAKNYDASPFTIPHEIGHILTNAMHYTDVLWEVNLMRTTPRLSDSVTSSKRLKSSQVERILSERLNLLK